MTLIAESESPAATSLAPVLRQVVQEIDRDMTVFDARSMQDIYINRAVKTPTVIAEIVSTLGVMGLTLARAVKRAHAKRVEVLAIYWHFVDVVWIVVFTVVYIIGR